MGAMKRHLFGTDGIRGLANAGNMSPEIAFRIGAALAYQAKKKGGHSPRIVIGKDTRVSGYLFETALASGICTMGGRVLLSGPLPTPAIAYLTRSMRADAGVVISASHNPYADNGIKIFGSDGFKLPDIDEAAIEELVSSDILDRDRPTGTHVGRAERLEDARGRYVTFVKSTFPAQRTLEGLRIVVDAAHGAAYRTAPAIFSELGGTVFPIGNKPNGKNINEGHGALHPDIVAAEVLRRKADIGVALDGDADRVILIDDKGRTVDGDAVMALCAIQMLRAKQLRKKTLVATIMSNLGLERAIEKEGGKLVRCDVGDRYVVETMRQGQYNLGGEQSGHLIFLDHTTTGDGLIAALQVVSICLDTEKALSELSDNVIEPVPQYLHNVTFHARKPLEDMAAMQRTVRDVNKILGKDGRLVIRWSGTEPKLRIMIEGDSKDKIHKLAISIADSAKKDLATPKGRTTIPPLP